MASLKEKLSVCIAKSDGDDALIDTLKAQIVQLEQQLASPALAKAEQTAAEAVELRKVRTAQEGKIEQQTQTINLLVGEIERLKEIRKVFVKTGLKQWMLDEAKIKADALESALSETTSLLQARDEKIVELEKTVTELTGKATHAVTRAQVLEMRLGNRPKATAGPGVPPPSARLVSVVSSLTGGPLGHGGGVEKGLALAEQLEVVSSEKNVLASAMSEAYVVLMSWRRSMLGCFIYCLQCTVPFACLLRCTLLFPPLTPILLLSPFTRFSSPCAVCTARIRRYRVSPASWKR